MRAFLLHRSQLAYALQHFSRESLTGHEQQMESCAHGVLPRLSRLSLAALLLVAGCGIAAAEPEKAGCTGFCSPVAPRQLDGLRAQGLAHPAGDTAVSVILWDEYRRTRAAPGDVLPANATAVPGGAALVNTASTIR